MQIKKPPTKHHHQRTFTKAKYPISAQITYAYLLNAWLLHAHLSGALLLFHTCLFALVTIITDSCSLGVSFMFPKLANDTSCEIYGVNSPLLLSPLRKATWVSLTSFLFSEWHSQQESKLVHIQARSGVSEHNKSRQRSHAITQRWTLVWHCWLPYVCKCSCLCHLHLDRSCLKWMMWDAIRL